MTRVFCDICGRNITDSKKRKNICIDKPMDVCADCYTRIWLAFDCVVAEIEEKGKWNHDTD